MLPDISEFLHEKEGFCHPDWGGIGERIEREIPEEEWNAAWGEAARRWLEKIQGQVEFKHEIYETPNFLMLCAGSKSVVRDAGRFYEESLREILANLEGVASDEGYGKHVVLMFESSDDYYGYVTYFSDVDEMPMSGGMCIQSEDFLHFAFPTPEYSSYRTVLVHELTHGCLAHRPIPLWLNEALAMRMEEVLCGSPIFELDQEIYERHGEHWNETTIQQFWSGESWQQANVGFELSYNLSQVLWRKFEGDLRPPPDVLMQFVAEAHWDDAGESAMKKVFELSLGDLVADFLGEGPWAPRPEMWPKQTVHHVIEKASSYEQFSRNLIKLLPLKENT